MAAVAWREDLPRRMRLVLLTLAAATLLLAVLQILRTA